MNRTTHLLLILAAVGTAWFTFSSCTVRPAEVVEPDLQVVYLAAYSVAYSQQLQQPVEVSFVVDCSEPEIDRKGRDFKAGPFSIKTSDDEDYRHNVWDKGHLAPAASFACDEAQFDQTFYWLNCALQHEALNRGPWKQVEQFEREMAKQFDTVRVDILCDFTQFSRVLETGATVPDAFRRHIRFGNQEIWLYFPNDSTVKGKDWENFKTMIRYFEPSLNL